MGKMIRCDIDPVSFDELAEENWQRTRFDDHSWYTPKMFGLPIYCHHAMETVREGKCYCRHHKYPALALELLTGGALEYEFDGVPYHAEAGELLLLQHNRDSAFRSGRNNRYEKLVIIINGSQLGVLLEALKLTQCWHLKIADMPAMVERFREIFTLLDEKADGGERRISELCYSLLLLLSELNSHPEAEYPESLERILSLLNRSYADKLNLDNLAAAGNVSVSTVIRLFNEHLGCPPLAYLTRLRIDLAASMLLTGNLPVKEVAWKVGYDNPLYFSSLFHRHKGLSPREFRTKVN